MEFDFANSFQGNFYFFSSGNAGSKGMLVGPIAGTEHRCAGQGS
jgi:hypothetical protein